MYLFNYHPQSARQPGKMLLSKDYCLYFNNQAVYPLQPKEVMQLKQLMMPI